MREILHDLFQMPDSAGSGGQAGLEKTQAILDTFWGKIQDKKLPVARDQADRFAKSMLEKNPPNGFLDRLLNVIHYFDKEVFHEDIKGLTEKVREAIGDKPYAVHCYGFYQTSGPWVFGQLLNDISEDGKQLHSPVGVYAYNTRPNVPPEGFIPVNPLENPIKQLDPKIVLLLPDDLIISGQHVMSLLGDEEDREIHPPTIIAALYISEEAKKLLETIYKNMRIVCQKVIPRVGRGLSAADFLFIKNLYKDKWNKPLDEADAAWISPITAQIIYYGKIPDNTFFFLYEGENPLFLPKDFRSPYKSVQPDAE